MAYLKQIVLILSFFLFQGILSELFSQISNTDKNDYLTADEHFEFGEYEEALQLLEILVKKYPDNANVNFLMGMCLLETKINYKEAKPYFEIAIRDIDAGFRPGDYENTSAPPEALLYYADVLQSNKEFRNASLTYHQYRDMMLNNPNALDIVNRRIIGLGISYEESIRSKGTTIDNLGSPINTKLDNYNPVIFGNNSRMFFTSNNGTQDLILYSEQINGIWNKPVDLTINVGSDGTFFTSSISWDETKLVLVKRDKYNSELYLSEFKNGKWNKAEPLDKKINSYANETGASFSKDGNKIYFSSDRMGGPGGYDIYFSISEGGKWSKAIPLEGAINTIYDETSPVLTYNGDTLFFCSNGHASMGQKDIFMTVITDKGWSAPENIGLPFNSVYDEDFYSCVPEYSVAYLSRFDENGLGKKDILRLASVNYTYPIPFTPAEQPEITQKTEPEGIIENVIEIAEVTEQLAEIPEFTETPIITEEITEKIEEPVIEPEILGNNFIEEQTETEPDEKEVTPILQGIEKKNEIIEIKTEEQEPESTPIEANSAEIIQDVVTPSYNESSQDEADSYYAYQQEKEEKKEVYIAPNQKTDQDKSIYTVQIMALRKPHSGYNFKNIKMNDLKISEGSDGYTRYTLGEYSNAKKAAAVMKKMEKLGYHDAFVRKIEEINNYRDEY